MSEGRSGRYVILTHDHPFLHWDLMLEWDGVLRTWRLHAEPEPETIIVCESLADHRAHYLGYEGPVSGGRGTVIRWDEGTYRAEDLAGDRVMIHACGQRLDGTLEMTRSEMADRWTFTYHPKHEQLSSR